MNKLTSWIIIVKIIYSRNYFLIEADRIIYYLRRHLLLSLVIEFEPFTLHFFEITF